MIRRLVGRARCWAGVAVVRGRRATASAATAEAPPARRVLVFSVPDVSWADLAEQPLPNLDRFFGRADVGALSTRAVHRQTTLADGYVSIGAGTRSVGEPTTDGDGLMPDETFGDDDGG